jgi:hypothetical protein
MDANTQALLPRSRSKVIAKYALASTFFSILAGFVLDVVRTLLPSVVPAHSVGSLDAGSIFEVSLTALVGTLVFRRLAAACASTYWPVAIPVAVAAGVLNFLCYALLSASTAAHYVIQLLLLCIAFDLLLALFGFALRPRDRKSVASPNTSLERTRDK